MERGARRVLTDDLIDITRGKAAWRRPRRVLTDDLLDRTEKARGKGAWRVQTAWNEKTPALPSPCRPMTAMDVTYG